MTRTTTRLDLIAVAGAFAVFAALVGYAIAKAGALEYPLDDVYIHLAMASEIARGGYGVNAGEIASAASSALYPLLLTPFPDTEFQRWLPVFWNLLGLGLTACLWGRALMWAGYSGPLGVTLAALAAWLTGGVSSAYLGMEHTLHAAASVAIVFGLARYLAEDRVTPMLWLGLLFAPLFRFEGLALVGLTVLTLAATGSVRTAIRAALIGFVPLGLFVLFLVWLGLGPLPESVQAKLVAAGEEDVTRLERIASTVAINLAKPGGRGIFGMVIAAIILRMMLPELRKGPMRWLAMAVIAAGGAHLLFGQVGWMERYEHYVLASVGIGVLILAAEATARRIPAIAVAVASILFGGWYYVQETINEYHWGSRAIYLQQTQMARYAQDFLDDNVAVNDLGRVAWGNPNYVLDLFGLSNAEARHIRLFDPVPGWGGPLIKKHDVAVIMIYDKAEMAGGSVAPEWVRLGKLVMRNPRGFLGDAEVHFYAADEGRVAAAGAALDAWWPTLPADACFVFEGDEKCRR